MIESHTAANGSVSPGDEWTKKLVADARRKWKRAEKYVKLLSEAT